MSDGQTLFLLLWLLYLSECCMWIGKRGVLFASPWLRSWRVAFASRYFGALEGGLTLLHPLPPLGCIFLSSWSPISISSEGVCAYNLQTTLDLGRPPQTGQAVLHNDIVEVTAHDTYLNINGLVFSKCISPAQARRFAELIRVVSAEPPEARETTLYNFFAAQLDLDAATQCLAHVNALVTKIRRVCSVFFMFLYVLVPLCVIFYGLTLFIIPVAVAMVLGALSIACLYHAAHKALFPSLRQERTAYIAKMILCPPVAIRAADGITVNALCRFHPILLAQMLLGTASHSYVCSAMRDLQYPLVHNLADGPALRIATWYREMELAVCVEFLQHQGIHTDGMHAPPPREHGCTAYCPRCDCQFTRGMTDCSDCPGVSLLSFPEEQSRDERAHNA